MSYRIHFTVGKYDDSFIVSGETVEDIANAANAELERRGLDAKRNNCWSEPTP